MNNENKTIHGYINIKSRQRRFSYMFENNCITVYSKGSLPLDEKEDVTIDFICNTKYVIGNDLSSDRHIVFFVDNIPFEDEGRIIWTSSSVEVYFYLVINVDWNKFNITKANYRFKELDVFFPLMNGLKREILFDDRTLKLQTVKYEDTVKSFDFISMNQQIKAELGILQTISGDASKPLQLSAILECSFEKTFNIELILDLYGTIKRLFCFLCHRRSVRIDFIKLYGMTEDTKRIPVGELHILFEKAIIENKKIIDKTPKYAAMENHFSDLVQLISDDKLYFEHIPENEDESHHITVSSFILNSAAFEWTFLHCYGEIPISEYRQKVKSDILKLFDNLLSRDDYNSKMKSEVKLYSKIVSGVDRNFSEKVLYALKNFDNVLSDFIKYIYDLNDMQFNDKTYISIANDLQYQRNAYAHGNIDKKMKENIISDTIILEWLNYCMVFKTVGYSDDEIFNLINAIFAMHHTERKVGKSI